jgi:hypothetical protein
MWKDAVRRPRMVRRLAIDGDGQGDLAEHGGEHRAVFVYQIGNVSSVEVTSTTASSMRISPADDEIAQLAAGREHMSVSEVNALLYMPVTQAKAARPFELRELV